MIIFLSIIESIRYDVQFIQNDLANCVVGVMDLQSRGLNFITTQILSLRQMAKKEELISHNYIITTSLNTPSIPIPGFEASPYPLVLKLPYLSLQAHSNIQTHIVV